MFYGLDVMDCNVKPSLAGGFRMLRGAPQGENTKGTFVKGHLCAYLNLIGYRLGPASPQQGFGGDRGGDRGYYYY